MKADNGLDEVNRNRNSKKCLGLGHILEGHLMRVPCKLDRNMRAKRNHQFFCRELQAILGIPWLAAASLYFLPPPSQACLLSVCLCLPLFVMASVMGLRAHPNPGRPHLNLAVPARTVSSGWTRILGNTMQLGPVAKGSAWLYFRLCFLE